MVEKIRIKINTLANKPYHDDNVGHSRQGHRDRLQSRITHGLPGIILVRELSNWYSRANPLAKPSFSSILKDQTDFVYFILQAFKP